MSLRGTVAGTVVSLVVGGAVVTVGHTATQPNAPALHCGTAAECRVTLHHLQAGLVRLKSTAVELESVPREQGRRVEGWRDGMDRLERGLTVAR